MSEFIMKIEAVETGNYELTCGNVVDIVDAAKRDLIGVAIMAYKYGLMRGQNKEKNRQRAKRKAVSA